MFSFLYSKFSYDTLIINRYLNINLYAYHQFKNNIWVFVYISNYRRMNESYRLLVTKNQCAPHYYANNMHGNKFFAPDYLRQYQSVSSAYPEVTISITPYHLLTLRLPQNHVCTQRDVFKILLIQTEIRLYLPLSD